DVMSYATIGNPRRRFSYYNDFINDLSTTANGEISESNAGTGAGTAVLNQVNANQVGLVQSSTGTTATGRATVQTASAMMVAGAGAMCFELNGRVTMLSDAVNEFTLRIGFFDNAGSDAADGIYFEYDRTQSTNWRLCAASNSTRTKTNSSTAAGTVFDTLRIDVNAAGTSDEFLLNGVSLGTDTTNHQNTTVRNFGFGWQLVKTAGTTARTFDVDYLVAELDFTTARA
ncbi:MAG: hypothetical protein ACREE7_07500, partial [Dongiaceae bacterium]